MSETAEASKIVETKPEHTRKVSLKIRTPDNPAERGGIFDLTDALGAFAEHLSRIPMTESMEQASFEFQMNAAILVERKIAEKEAKEDLPPKIEWSENKSRENPIDIVRKGLEIFEQNHPEIKIVFDVPEKRIGEIDFIRAIGMYETVMGKFPVKEDLTHAFWNLGIQDEKVREIAKSAYERETEYVPDSHPLLMFFHKQKTVRQEDLFAKALELTDGKVFEAVEMVAVVTKSILRPDLESVDYQPDVWVRGIRVKMADQLSDFVPFSSLPPVEPVDSDDRTLFNYSYINRMGSIYHMWEIIRLTQYFTPEMVRVMVLGEYAYHLREHGHLKLLSDLRVLADLYKIQEVFKKEAVRNA